MNDSTRWGGVSKKSARHFSEGRSCASVRDPVIVAPKMSVSSSTVAKRMVSSARWGRRMTERSLVLIAG